MEETAITGPIRSEIMAIACSIVARLSPRFDPNAITALMAFRFYHINLASIKETGTSDRA